MCLTEKKKKPFNPGPIEINDNAFSDYPECRNVLFCLPGAVPEELTIKNALNLMRIFGGADSMRILPTYDVTMIYCSGAVVNKTFDSYLVGPAVVFAEYDDFGIIRRILEQRTEKIKYNCHSYKAFLL